MSQRRKEPEQQIEQPKIQPAGPGPRGGPGAMMGGEKVKTEHPRSVLWRWIFHYLKAVAMKWIGFAIIMILATIISTSVFLISATIINNGILARNMDVLNFLTVIYLGITLTNAFLNYIGNYGLSKIGQRIIYNVRNDLINKLQQTSMAYYDRRLSGDIISITTNDVELLNNLVGTQLVSIIQSAVSIGVTFAVMAILSPILAIVSTVVFPVYIVAVRMFRRQTKGVFKEMRKKMSAVTSSIQENVAGAKVVQSFGQEKKAANEFDRVNQENYKVGLKMRKIISTFFPLIGFLSSLLVAFVLFMGGITSINGWIFFGSPVTPGALVAFIGLLAQF